LCRSWCCCWCRFGVIAGVVVGIDLGILVVDDNGVVVCMVFGATVGVFIALVVAAVVVDILRMTCCGKLICVIGLECIFPCHYINDHNYCGKMQCV